MSYGVRVFSQTWKYLLDNRLSVTSGETTHLLLDKGKYFVPEAMMDGFREHMARDVTASNVLSISENHTMVFPMYVDADIEGIPFPALDGEALLEIARILNTQVQRFFEDRHEPFDCLVCNKGDTLGSALADGGFKHGVHFHWPHLMVNIDMAYQLRASMIAGLDRFDGWEALLGKERIPWESCIDGSVYSGGLRMVGAPKSVKCSACHGTCSEKKPCGTCGNANNGHIHAPGAYRLCMVVTGREVNAAKKAHIDANSVRLLKETTVRAKEGTVVTPGYRVYTGCPHVDAKMNGRKRSAGAANLAEKSVEPRFRRQPDITDPNIHRIAREHLVKHSPNYANARMIIRTDGKIYKVLLTGEGSNWCGNKNADHNRQHVYMEIVGGKSNGYVSQMRCWCKCPTTEKRVGGRPCKDYVSPKRDLTKDEASHFFKQPTDTPEQFLANERKTLDALHKK